MATRELQENEVFDEKYRVLGRIGRGGMAIVYRVVDVGAVPAEHALKVIRRSAFPTEEALSVAKVRFLLEARTTARLRHPHIVDVHRYGEAPDGSPYLLLELLDGQDLATVLRRRQSLPWATALEVAEQAAQALDVVHGAGHVHRDLSPGNLFLCRLTAAPPEDRVFVKLLDLGIAVALDGSEGPRPVSLTQPELRIGNPLYMTPESILKKPGVPLDARADQFSLACILFEMLAGYPAFRPTEGEPLEHAFVLILSTDPLDRPLPPVFNAPLRAVLGRALAKDPTQRYSTLQEFVAALKAVIPGADSYSAAGPTSVQSLVPARPRRRWRSSLKWLAVAGGLSAAGIVWGPNVFARLPARGPGLPDMAVAAAEPETEPAPSPPEVKPLPSEPEIKDEPAAPPPKPVPDKPATPEKRPRAGLSVDFKYADSAQEALVKPHAAEYKALIKKCLSNQSDWRNVEIRFRTGIRVVGLSSAESNSDVAGCLDGAFVSNLPRPTEAVIKRR